jgi:hypothetical protein
MLAVKIPVVGIVVFIAMVLVWIHVVIIVTAVVWEELTNYTNFIKKLNFV